MFPFSGEHQRGVNVYGTTGQGSQYINFDDDELDESYNPNSDDDVSQHDFELTDSEYANFQYENEGNELANRISVEDAN
ncbi:hypothetical protein AAC387_Pa12g0593 [Persea americana]